MPMGEYESFNECVEKNQDKEDPEAYCGEIKKRAEDLQEIEGYKLWSSDAFNKYGQFKGKSTAKAYLSKGVWIPKSQVKKLGSELFLRDWLFEEKKKEYQINSLKEYLNEVKESLSKLEKIQSEENEIFSSESKEHKIEHAKKSIEESLNRFNYVKEHSDKEAFNAFLESYKQDIEKQVQKIEEFKKTNKPQGLIEQEQEVLNAMKLAFKEVRSNQKTQYPEKGSKALYEATEGKGKGWHGDSNRHSKAAKKGWENRSDLVDDFDSDCVFTSYEVIKEKYPQVHHRKALDFSVAWCKKRNKDKSIGKDFDCSDYYNFIQKKIIEEINYDMWIKQTTEDLLKQWESNENRVDDLNFLDRIKEWTKNIFTTTKPEATQEGYTGPKRIRRPFRIENTETGQVVEGESVQSNVLKQITMTPVSSSNVKSIGVFNNQLVVQFHEDGEAAYRYNFDNFDEAVNAYKSLFSSGSPGRWIWKNIRGHEAGQSVSKAKIGPAITSGRPTIGGTTSSIVNYEKSSKPPVRRVNKFQEISNQLRRQTSNPFQDPNRRRSEIERELQFRRKLRNTEQFPYFQEGDPRNEYEASFYGVDMQTNDTVEEIIEWVEENVQDKGDKTPEEIAFAILNSLKKKKKESKKENWKEAWESQGKKFEQYREARKQYKQYKENKQKARQYSIMGYDMEDKITTDFARVSDSVLGGYIVRSGPFQYPNGVKYKDGQNLKEVYENLDYAVAYGSTEPDSHTEAEDRFIGYWSDFQYVPKGEPGIYGEDDIDEKYDRVAAKLYTTKPIEELSDLEGDYTNLPVSASYEDLGWANKQIVGDVYHIAVSLNKNEQDRCSTLSGTPCNVSLHRDMLTTKGVLTADFSQRPTNKQRDDTMGDKKKKDKDDKDYDDEEGDEPGEQDTGPDEKDFTDIQNAQKVEVEATMDEFNVEERIRGDPQQNNERLTDRTLAEDERQANWGYSKKDFIEMQEELKELREVKDMLPMVKQIIQERESKQKKERTDMLELLIEEPYNLPKEKIEDFTLEQLKQQKEIQDTLPHVQDFNANEKHITHEDVDKLMDFKPPKQDSRQEVLKSAQTKHQDFQKIKQEID